MLSFSICHTWTPTPTTVLFVTVQLIHQHVTLGYLLMHTGSFSHYLAQTPRQVFTTTNKLFIYTIIPQLIRRSLILLFTSKYKHFIRLLIFYKH